MHGTLGSPSLMGCQVLPKSVLMQTPPGAFGPSMLVHSGTSCWSDHAAYSTPSVAGSQTTRKQVFVQGLPVLASDQDAPRSSLRARPMSV